MIPISKPTIVRKDLEYVLNCLITERLEEGELAREFEKAIANLMTIKYSLATHSFSSALHLALLSMEIKSGDEVIISAYSGSFLLNTLKLVNAKPLLADIELKSYNMDPKSVQKLITSRTKAIIISHNFGIPADLDEFLKMNVPLIEDCSFSFCAEYYSELEKNKTKTGQFGILSVFSFDTDTIITTGDGGMILSEKRDLILKAKSLKFNPFMENIDNQFQYDYRMSDISAALGLSQIKIINKLLERRAELAKYYDRRLKKSKYKTYKPFNNRKNVYTKYPILLNTNLEKTIDFLRKNKIDARKPVINPAYKLLGLDEKIYPHAAHSYHKLLEIPVYPSLKKKEIEKIADTLLKVI